MVVFIQISNFYSMSGFGSLTRHVFLISKKKKKVISQEHFHQHLSSMTPRVNLLSITTCGAV